MKIGGHACFLLLVVGVALTIRKESPEVAVTGCFKGCWRDAKGKRVLHEAHEEDTKLVNRKQVNLRVLRALRVTSCNSCLIKGTNG